MGSQVTMHSAEWLRGAVAVLGQSVRAVIYRRLLAEAEAREAAIARATQLHDTYPHTEEPSLADQLAAAKAEVVKLAELVKEYLDPEEWKHENRAGWILCSGCGSQLDIGRYHAPDCKWVTRVKQAESPALAWLAARDARMKALGAAEVWEIVAERSKLVGDSAGEQYARAEATRLAEVE